MFNGNVRKLTITNTKQQYEDASLKTVIYGLIYGREAANEERQRDKKGKQ